MKRKGFGYWTKETCQVEAMKYNTRFEFQKWSNGAYVKARKNGWLDDICSHMTTVGNLFNRCVYSIEFDDNHVYIGLTYNLEKRFNDHISDVHYNSSSVLKHIKLTNSIPRLKQLSNYIGVKDAAKLEDDIRMEYFKNKWIILNRIKCGGLGGDIIKWTKSKCIEEAMKYKELSQFNKNSRCAYNAAKKYGWLDEMSVHMSKIIHWIRDKELCREEAMKYETRKDFSEKSRGAYSAAYENEWLDDICSHMKNNGYIINKKGTWQNKERCRDEAMKYDTRISFQRGSKGAYVSSLSNGWIDDICSHMIKQKSIKE